MKLVRTLAHMCLLLCAATTARAQTFTFELDNPRASISIPSLPQLKMELHALHQKQAHLRYSGKAMPYAISILTPTSTPGMTAVECATGHIRTLSRIPGVPPSDSIFKTKINEHTYAAIYAVPMEGFVMLHAHFVSAVGGTHCVQVHASKVSRSQEDLDPWFKGFGQANIEAK